MKDNNVKNYAEIADDFYFNIILLKSLDFQNESIVFLYAHALELSAKTACYELGLDIGKLGHRLMDIYSLLEIYNTEITSLKPKPNESKDYSKMWLKSNAGHTNHYLGTLDELFRLELAFCIDNIVDLKYGYTKDNISLSVLRVYYEHVNPDFIKLYNACRSLYRNEELDNRFYNKMYSVFKNIEDTKSKLNLYIF